MKPIDIFLAKERVYKSFDIINSDEQAVTYSTEVFYNLELTGTAQLILSLNCRINRLHLGRGLRPHPHPNECPVYDGKQSGGEVPVMLELWEMRSTHSLPSFPGLGGNT